MVVGLQLDSWSANAAIKRGGTCETLGVKTVKGQSTMLTAKLASGSLENLNVVGAGLVR